MPIAPSILAEPYRISRLQYAQNLDIKMVKKALLIWKIYRVLLNRAQAINTTNLTWTEPDKITVLYRRIALTSYIAGSLQRVSIFLIF